MERLPELSVDLIDNIDELFKEEAPKRLIQRVHDGTILEYLGTRLVVHKLKELANTEDD